MARDLIDLGMITRLSGVPRNLVARHVRKHGPDPVGRVGKTPYWNLEDLDPLLAAVEQGKARDKSKPQVVVIPDENDALNSRVRLFHAGELAPVYLRAAGGEPVELGTLRGFTESLGLDVDNLRDLVGGDELKVARNIGDVLRGVLSPSNTDA